METEAEKQKREAREERQKELPFSRLFPNLVTIGGLCCGLSAIRFAMLGKWEISVAFILAAALIDGMDGRIARMLGATSVFGAQLDSLSDFVCFGIAPALILYHWQLYEVKGIGWAVVLFYAVCCALRLARFNTSITEVKQAAWQKKFFTGVPSPAGGLLCLWPLIVFIQFGHEARLPIFYTAIHLFIVGILMVSRIPTFAAKNLRIRTDLILPVMLACALMVVLFVIEPWGMAAIASLLYLLHIPLAWRYYKKLEKSSRDATLAK